MSHVRYSLEKSDRADDQILLTASKVIFEIDLDFESISINHRCSQSAIAVTPKVDSLIFLTSEFYTALDNLLRISSVLLFLSLFSL
ncbi:MAG: hypothetical protein A2Z20_11390 [Bdellovibrionales bacterium RBG_16_40_8]|nr:MAG: hypothetical protein A2Z20_11390 [Bdellovibrionales bacterium RBG_16_40_8]